MRKPFCLVPNRPVGSAIASAVGLLIVTAVPALSQAPSACPTVGGGWSSQVINRESVLTYNFPQIMFKGIAGAPYSGQMTSETVHTLPDGTHVSQPANVLPMMYRDSLGRERMDRRMGRVSPVPNLAPQILSLAQIADFDARYLYIIDDLHQIVHRIATCTPGTAAPAVPVGSVRTEDLGTQTMLGVTVTGERQTTTFPSGTYRGNDAPVTQVRETWRSAKFGLEFLIKTTTPDGDTIQTMTKFTAGEPDPTLFMPPPGYRIIDETAQFAITIPLQPSPAR